MLAYKYIFMLLSTKSGFNFLLSTFDCFLDMSDSYLILMAFSKIFYIETEFLPADFLGIWDPQGEVLIYLWFCVFREKNRRLRDKFRPIRTIFALKQEWKLYEIISKYHFRSFCFLIEKK